MKVGTLIGFIIVIIVISCIDTAPNNRNSNQSTSQNVYPDSNRHGGPNNSSSRSERHNQSGHNNLARFFGISPSTTQTRHRNGARSTNSSRSGRGNHNTGSSNTSVSGQGNSTTTNSTPGQGSSTTPASTTGQNRSTATGATTGQRRSTNLNISRTTQSQSTVRNGNERRRRENESREQLRRRQAAAAAAENRILNPELPSPIHTGRTITGPRTVSGRQAPNNTNSNSGQRREPRPDYPEGFLPPGEYAWGKEKTGPWYNHYNDY